MGEYIVCKWKSVLLKPTDTMEDAIRCLGSESLRIVMVADEHGRLLGTITDGDIRRALMQHLGMTTHLSKVMFTNPSVASSDDDRDVILAMMKKRDLLQVPIIDKHRCITGLETIQHLLHGNKLDNYVVLMAGGLGKRLRPLTNDIPKPLLKVGDKPILETILNQFVASGFQNFYISTQYKADMVRDYFGDGKQWGVNIEYVHEKEPLGTAGALGLLPNLSSNLPVIVMNGDLLTKVDFERLLQFHNEQGGCATMCVREYDFQVPYGVVESKEHVVVSIVEKPVHKFFVNAGIYVLETELINLLEENTYMDMPQLLENQIQEGLQVNLFPLHEYWLDIGRTEEYEKAQNDVSHFL